MKGRVAKGSAGTFALQVAEAGLGFLTSVVLARALGAAEYGAYAFAIALAGFLLIPALLGHNTQAVREGAALIATSAWASLRAFVSGARKRVLLSSAIVALGGLGVLWLTGGTLPTNVQQAARLAILMVPAVALMRLYEGFLRGAGNVVMAQLADKAVRPALFLCAALAASAMYSDFGLGVEAVALNVATTVIALLLTLTFWYRLRPAQLVKVVPDPAGDKGLRHALPFALLSGLSVINAEADILMLGFLSTAEEVGYYRVASRVATLVIFGLTAVGAALSPRLAALHATGELAEIQRLVSKAALATTALALPVTLVLVFAGDRVLLLFGEEFQRGTMPLAILSLGQLVNAAIGVVGVLLVMTGHQGLVARTLAVSALLNVVLNAILIPLYGAVGAAASTTTTLIVWNVALAILVKRELQINATVFSGITQLRRKIENVPCASVHKR